HHDDGISTMDTGSNGQMLPMNIESIGEVKILTQGYQAEYGRSSGLQITAVTKSGTNRFHGSLYDVERKSAWNANSWVTSKNRYPLPNTTQAINTTYNYQMGGDGFPALPTVENLTRQPAIRIDYDMLSKLRLTGKYSGQRARPIVTPGLIPGFTDVLTPYPYITNYAVTVNYTMNPTTFIEGTYGFIRNELTGGNEGGVLVNET